MGIRSNIIGGVVSVGGGSYTASAVHFDGTATLDNDELSSTDNSNWSYSGWYSVPASPGCFWVSDPANQFNNDETFDGTPNWYFSFGNVTAADFIANTNGLPLIAGAWFHILVSAELGFDAGARKIQIYLNDVDVTDTLTFAEGGGPISLSVNGLPFYFGTDSIRTSTGFDAADHWNAPGVSLLDGSGDIPLATRRIFIDESGKPVNPSGFPAGAILFSGNASTFGTNQGTGGAFTLTGSLTNASSSPSD